MGARLPDHLTDGEQSATQEPVKAVDALTPGAAAALAAVLSLMADHGRKDGGAIHD